MRDYRKSRNYFLQESFRVVAYNAIEKALKILISEGALIRSDILNALEILRERVENPPVFEEEYRASEDSLHSKALCVFSDDKLDLTYYEFEMAVMWAMTVNSYYMGPACRDHVLDSMKESLAFSLRLL
ncbi:MAG: hypothetical protein PVI90_00430 [Desulfobacteraceae bacterium]|jgi:hypothetical protein